MSVCSRLWLILLALPAATTAFAQDEDDELAPGLVANYTSGDIVIRRVDADLAWDWKTGSPDFRLPAGPFRAKWSGQVLLREEGTYRWHAHLHGKLVVRINDHVVLEANAETPQWVSGDGVELSFGELPINVDYESAGTSARLLLAWSSSRFPLEPLPHHVLFHEQTEKLTGPIPAAALTISQHRCDRCHGEIAGLKSPPGPSLVHIGEETSEQWLLDHIQHGGGENGHMPRFGFSRTDTQSILAVLRYRPKGFAFGASNSKPIDFPPTSVPDQLLPNDVEAGRELLISTGCLACHQWNKQGRTGEFSGPPLDDIGTHRTARWLELWLTEPAKINPHHRMPVFTLNQDERRQIVSTLLFDHKRLKSPPKPQEPLPEFETRGRKLIDEARCVACHELPSSKLSHQPAPKWHNMNLDGDGCWSAERSSSKRRPYYAKLDAVALRAYLHTIRNLDYKPSADLLGSQLLLQKGCLNCHDRDGRKGISSIAAELAKATPNLNGRAPWLIPPQLTAVGDRLPDERLAKAIRGELPTRRLDWLMVRMPKYQHTEAEQAALMAHLIGHDRIPPAAPATPEYPRNGKQSEMTLAGRELLGGKGFSCVACHPVKDFVPKQVALGTRGSNLFGLGDRLRPDYFFRWTRAPLRVMPGVEMPSYQRPHAAILPGDLNRQLAALWTALNDPDLPTPVNPGAVEQYWTVGPNDSPRILRDVITLPGKKEITVSRSFAVGFPNGHNVLFDLDTASVRAWTVGDFAQQRTQGKSWVWDLVGTPVMVNEDGDSDILILAEDGRTVLFPSKRARIELQMSNIQANSTGNGIKYDHVAFNYCVVLNDPEYQLDRQSLSTITFYETWRVEKNLNGWRREINREITTPNPTVSIWLLRPEKMGGEQSWVIEPPHDTSWQAVPNTIRQGLLLASPSSEKDTVLEEPLEISYSTISVPITLKPPMTAVQRSEIDEINAVPGFLGQRLPYPRTIMPTAITFNHKGRMFFTSLKGHVYSADDHEAKLFAEGLAAPFGILYCHEMLLVAHKPEIIGLIDTSDYDQTNETYVYATGWGLTDDYHDWTCGLVRDAEGNLFTTLGSDYAQKDRPKEKSRWRGHALKIDPSGKIESVARGIRYSTGLAMTSQQQIFFTDQQGLQNTFNELNWLPHSEGSPASQSPSRASDVLRFGVPSLHEEDRDAPATPPAVQIPHPWTRSVNGITAIPKSLADRTHPKLFDQLLGCEYDNRMLIRLSWQLVDGVMQGAAYPFSKPGLSSSRALPNEGSPANQGLSRASDAPTSDGLLGPLSIAVSPDGDVYVGSIHDSGWQGGLNTGDIVKLAPSGEWPNGLAEIRATPTGFDLEFFHPVDRERAMDKSRYQVSGYTRVWQGAYATPDSGRHNVELEAAKLNAEGTTVSLQLFGLKPGHVYDISVGEIGLGEERALWPNIGHYTLHRLPK